MPLTDDPVTQHLRALRRRDIRRVIGTLTFSLLSAPFVGIAQIEVEQWLAAGASAGQSRGPAVERTTQASPVGRGAYRAPVHWVTFSTCGSVSAWQGEVEITRQGDMMNDNTQHLVRIFASRPFQHCPSEAGAHD